MVVVPVCLSERGEGDVIFGEKVCYLCQSVSVKEVWSQGKRGGLCASLSQERRVKKAWFYERGVVFVPVSVKEVWSLCKSVSGKGVWSQKDVCSLCQSFLVKGVWSQ